MTYQHTLDYLFARLPMYQRIGAAAYKADLNNTHKIVEVLNHPQKKIKCIHVAGTNGKGSSSHMLAAILQQAGYKTGLYTSPHLIDFRERIKINGKLIPKKYVVDFVEKHKTEFEKIEPSFFEWTVGLAFDYFANQKVDIAVIEVGLGGRLDSTNVIMPLVSLITNISFDHVNLLGNTLQKIATEKAGIIKPKTPVVVSQTQAEIKNVFTSIAKKQKAPIYFADNNFKVVNHKTEKGLLKILVLNKESKKELNYSLDLTGSYQLKNIVGVLEIIKILKTNNFNIPEKAIKSALKNVCSLTGLLGRWQQLSKNPLIILDTGHNEDGIKQVLKNISNIKYKHLNFVFGAVNDKDVSKILSLLPKKATYYFVKASVPRALDANELLNQAKKFKLNGTSYSSVKEGISAAKKSYKKTDLIFVGGSTFVVADALS
ncbi:MAG: folylpolyglutamate synthase/dihydrofolate synthase family protein [Bacteroidota bacterium]|nr:folylpolyglutamate synthase/dihydrofolate synthase family protein [Bacteroidota bacterium]